MKHSRLSSHALTRIAIHVAQTQQVARICTSHNSAEQTYAFTVKLASHIQNFSCPNQRASNVVADTNRYSVLFYSAATVSVEYYCAANSIKLLINLTPQSGNFDFRNHLCVPNLFYMASCKVLHQFCKESYPLLHHGTYFIQICLLYL